MEQCTMDLTLGTALSQSGRLRQLTTPLGASNVCKEGFHNNSPGHAHRDVYNDQSGRTQYATLYSLIRSSKDVQI